MAGKNEADANSLAKAISQNMTEACKQGGFSYVRRLSEPELSGGFIFLERESLWRFPGTGEEFTVRAGKKKAVAKVEAYACNCTGPGLLHSHWKLTGLKGLICSKAVRIRETSSGFALERVSE